MTGDETIRITQAELQAMLTKAAHDGAQRALADVGLGDKAAVDDVREFRALMQSYRLAKRVALKAIVQKVVNLLFMLALLGLASKFGIKLVTG